jgi:hypothetical protein
MFLILLLMTADYGSCSKVFAEVIHEMASKIQGNRLQEVVQSAGITPNDAEVTSSNPLPPSCVDMSKKEIQGNQMLEFGFVSSYA